MATTDLPELRATRHGPTLGSRQDRTSQISHTARTGRDTHAHTYSGPRAIAPAHRSCRSRCTRKRDGTRLGAQDTASARPLHMLTVALDPAHICRYRNSVCMYDRHSPPGRDNHGADRPSGFIHVCAHPATRVRNTAPVTSCDTVSTRRSPVNLGESATRGQGPLIRRPYQSSHAAQADMGGAARDLPVPGVRTATGVAPPGEPRSVCRRGVAPPPPPPS